MGVVLMSKRELNRIDVLARLDGRRLTTLAAAELVRVTAAADPSVVEAIPRQGFFSKLTRTTRRNKRQRRHEYSGYRCGSHDTRPLARSLARQYPQVEPAPICSGLQVRLTGHPIGQSC